MDGSRGGDIGNATARPPRWPDGAAEASVTNGSRSGADGRGYAGEVLRVRDGDRATSEAMPAMYAPAGTGAVSTHGEGESDRDAVLAKREGAGKECAPDLGRQNVSGPCADH